MGFRTATTTTTSSILHSKRVNQREVDNNRYTLQNEPKAISTPNTQILCVFVCVRSPKIIKFPLEMNISFNFL